MRCSLHIIVAAGAAAVLAGCALGPDYHRPKENIPATYRFEQTTGTNAFADEGWWELYQDPTLQSLIREALNNNLDVRIAAARVEQAHALLGSTRLQQLPQVSALGYRDTRARTPGTASSRATADR